MKEEDNNIKKTKDFQRWLAGIPYEVAFWRSYYGNKKRRNDLFRWSLFNKPCVLDNFNIAQYISSLCISDPKLLDVGCALSYMFGNIINGRRIEVIYVDPLAPFYNRILKKYKIDRPEISFGMIESLSGSFAPETVDFVHVRNALDHCSDPFEGIIQSLVILKKGGVLYLNHFKNEAENEAYRGFHQFNIDIEEDNLILWNKGTNINVTEACKEFASVETSTTAEGRIVAVITKHGDIPTSLYNPEELSKRMTQRMMATVEYFHDFNHTASYQTKRLISTIGHRFMRLMPYTLLRKIKKFAGK